MIRSGRNTHRLVCRAGQIPLLLFYRRAERRIYHHLVVNYPPYYERNIEPKLRSALADTPVVLLNVARQTGKSALAQSYAKASSVP